MTIEKAEAELYPPLTATAARIATAIRNRALAQANSLTEGSALIGADA